MPAFSGYRADHTPSTTADNYTLDATGTGKTARVRWISWGGRGTTSTGYQTRWVRPTTAGVTPTAGAMEAQNPLYATPSCTLATIWGTQPVLPASPDALHLQDWNVHGGVGMIVLPLGAEWIVTTGILTAELSCRNGAGTDAALSSYGICWEE